MITATGVMTHEIGPIIDTFLPVETKRDAGDSADMQFCDRQS